MLGLLTFVLGVAFPVFATANPRRSESYGKLPLNFEANQGQAHEDVRFLSRGPGFSLYLTAGAAVPGSLIGNSHVAVDAFDVTIGGGSTAPPLLPPLALPPLPVVPPPLPVLGM